MTFQNIQKYTIALLFLSCASAVFAQQDTTMNKQVQVVKAYRPTVGTAQKVNTYPVIKDTTVFTPTFEYIIQDQVLAVKQTGTPLAAAKMNSKRRYEQGKGFAIVGIGNGITPYGELFMNTQPSKKADFGVHLRHKSSFPELELENGISVDAPYDHTLVDIFGVQSYKKSSLSWDLIYQRDGFRYYGSPILDTALYHLYFDDLDQKNQAYNTASTSFQLKSKPSRKSFKYTIGAGYDFVNARTKQMMHDAHLNVDLEGDYRDVTIGGVFDVYYNLTSGIQTRYNTDQRQAIYFGISPYISFSGDKWRLKAGVNVKHLLDADTTAVGNYSPLIDFVYMPLPGEFEIFVQSTGGIDQHKLSQIPSENPYANPNYVLPVTNTMLDVKGGFSGYIAKMLAYKVETRYQMFEDALNWGHIVAYSDVDYANTLFASSIDYNRVSLGGALRFTGSERFSLEVSGNYFFYDEDEIWHMPNYELSFDTNISITNKIKSSIRFNTIGERIASNYAHNLVALEMSSGPVEMVPNTLNAIYNLGLNVNYQFDNSLKFFVDADNLLNQHYEVWDGYMNQGIVVMLGASFGF